MISGIVIIVTTATSTKQWRQQHAGYPLLASSSPPSFSALLFALGGWPCWRYLLDSLVLLARVGFSQWKLIAGDQMAEREWDYNIFFLVSDLHHRGPSIFCLFYGLTAVRHLLFHLSSSISAIIFISFFWIILTLLSEIQVWLSSG